MKHRGQTPANRPDRPSLRALLVPRLLSHGLAAEHVARITGVPAALVWLIGEEQGSTGPAIPPGEAAPCIRKKRRRLRGPEHLRRLAVLGVYAAGCALTILWHQPIMPLAVAAAVLITAPRPAGRHPAQ